MGALSFKFYLTLMAMWLFPFSTFAEDAGEVVGGAPERETYLSATAKARPFVSCTGNASEPIRVVIDITRGVQTATVYEGSKIVRSYKVSGGRNKREYNDHEGRVCSFTSVGVTKPKFLIRDRKSTAHNGAPMPFYVDLDTDRAVGTHAGDTSGYSGGCIRQSKKDSEWLYHYVAKHSTFDEKNHIDCSDVTFEVIDNTPGVAEARAECFKGIGKPEPIMTLAEPTPALPRPRATPRARELPTDQFENVPYGATQQEQDLKKIIEQLDPTLSGGLY